MQRSTAVLRATMPEQVSVGSEMVERLNSTDGACVPQHQLEHVPQDALEHDKDALPGRPATARERSACAAVSPRLARRGTVAHTHPALIKIPIPNVHASLPLACRLTKSVL